MPHCFLYFFFFNVAKTKSSFFSPLYFATLQYLCVFFFFLNLKGTALCMFIN